MMNEENIRLTNHTTCLSFLKCCLAEHSDQWVDIKRANWQNIIDFARKQSIVGVYWKGINALDEQVKALLTDDDVLDWMSECCAIEKRNKFVYKKAAWVYNNFNKEGFDCCILKGQGNALVYPDVLERTCGDIDVWLWPKQSRGVEGRCKTIAERRKVILDYVRKYVPHAPLRYHHAEFNVINGLPVEVHFFPLNMNNPWSNRKLQRWFDEVHEEQFSHEVAFSLPEQGTEQGAATGATEKLKFCTPTNGFNLVYQMCHILHHFFDEGIGLRQMIDYFYLLQQNITDTEKTDAVKWFKQLHIEDFAKAVMYIQQEVLGLSKQYLLVEPDERHGKILLDEILQGGNFGKEFAFSHANAGKKYFAKIARNIRLVSMCPSEALWEPWFRTWHFFWRIYARTI